MRFLSPANIAKWATVKSVLIGPQSPAFATEAGINHIYANSKALEGYEAGTFPDGSILVYKLLDTTEASGATSEGTLKRVDVMVKDSQGFHDRAVGILPGSAMGAGPMEQFRLTPRLVAIAATGRRKTMILCSVNSVSEVSGRERRFPPVCRA